MTTKTTTISFILSLFIYTHVSAQKNQSYDLHALFSAKQLTSYNRTVTLVDDGHKGIKLSEQDGEGVVWLKDLKFSSGTIEFDVRGKDVFQKSFVGVAFHAVNDSTYDGVYFRPFNFHAADPVRKIHAVQYISHPDFTWNKLRTERNGVFEKALVAPPDPNAWFHARVVVKDNTVSVFVNEDKVPSLTVPKLNDRKDGNIGVWVGDGSGGEFANVVLRND